MLPSHRLIEFTPRKTCSFLMRQNGISLDYRLKSPWLRIHFSCPAAIPINLSVAAYSDDRLVDLPMNLTARFLSFPNSRIIPQARHVSNIHKINGCEISEEPCGMFISIYPSFCLSLLVHDWSVPCVGRLSLTESTVCILLWWLSCVFGLNAWLESEWWM